MIYKLSKRFIFDKMISLDDIMQEGRLAVCQAVKKHDSSKGSLCTVVYNQIMSRLYKLSIQNKIKSRGENSSLILSPPVLISFEDIPEPHREDKSIDILLMLADVETAMNTLTEKDRAKGLTNRSVRSKVKKILST